MNQNTEPATAPGEQIAPESAHVLKTDPLVFDAVLSGEKTFEIRFDDRGFKVGDLLHLRRTEHAGQKMKEGAPLIYCGDLMRRVTYILRGPIYGLAEGWVIMGIEVLSEQPARDAESAEERVRLMCEEYGVNATALHCDIFAKHLTAHAAAKDAQLATAQAELARLKADRAKLEAALDGRVGSLASGQDPLEYALQEYVRSEDALPEWCDQEDYTLSGSVQQLAQISEEQDRAATDPRGDARIGKGTQLCQRCRKLTANCECAPRGDAAMQYVAGFMFSKDLSTVALVRKNKPAWQAGKLNGIGGKVEAGETPEQAMAREFKEETGVDCLAWREYHVMRAREEGWTVRFFYAVGDLFELRTMEQEVIERHEVKSIMHGREDIIENLPWLVPLALDVMDDGRPSMSGSTYGDAATEGGAK